MGNNATEEIIGGDFSDMDIIRALHLAKNDPTAAINIIFDMPRSFRKPEFPKKPESSLNAEPPVVDESTIKHSVSRLKDPDSAASSNVNLKSMSGSNQLSGNGCTDSGNSEEMGSAWWFVGSGEVTGLSTCKGKTLKPGDEVNFTFPAQKKLTTSSPEKIDGGRGRQVATCSEIIRFSTSACGEHLCKQFMFQKSQQMSLKVASNSAEESIIHPLPTLFKLLGRIPFKKAEFTPGDLYTRKRPLNSEDSSLLPPTISHINKFKSASSGNENNGENEESVSENDLDNIVGVTDRSELEPPSTVLCELRPYQKQALRWMIQLERGHCGDAYQDTVEEKMEAVQARKQRMLSGALTDDEEVRTAQIEELKMLFT